MGAGKRTAFDIIQIHVASDLQVIASQPGRWTHLYLHGILDMAHFIENLNCGQGGRYPEELYSCVGRESIVSTG